jgi:uncharacterized paraquat-inducible protein A
MEELDIQIELQEKIQKQGINLISCSHCDTILFHKTETREFNCWSCKQKVYPNDCEDFYYTGMGENSY